jgi:hypothetical protein
MVRKIIKITFFSVLSAVMIMACYYDNEEELYPAECVTDSVSYTGNISNIINTNCAISGCHSGAQSPNLSNYSGASSNLQRIEQRAINLKTMPPNNALTTCEIEQLKTWIGQDGNEN